MKDADELTVEAIDQQIFLKHIPQVENFAIIFTDKKLVNYVRGAFQIGSFIIFLIQFLLKINVYIANERFDYC
jgi:hypothetical protein